MEYRRIEYFLTAAEILNFTEAAGALYITPQALAKQISIFEKELGARLFDLTARTIHLTSFGEECYSRFSEVKKVMDSAIKDMLTIAKEASDTLRIGFFSALPKNEIIMPILNQISDRSSDLKIEINSSNIDQVRDWLVNDEIDICITITHGYEDWQEFKTVDVNSTPADIVVAPIHPWAEKETITEQDIENGSILLLKSTPPIDPSSNYPVPCRQRRYAQNFESMRVMLEAGKDFAVFPKEINNIFHADFKHFDIPERLQFQYHIICAYKKSNSKIKHFEFLSSLDMDEIIKI